jgi:hypothetical protein
MTTGDILTKALELAEKNARNGDVMATADCLRHTGLTAVAALVERGYWDHRALVRVAETCARREVMS